MDERADTGNPWLRAGVSIGVVPAYLLLTHALAGVVYRAMQAQLPLADRVISAGIWAVAGALIVGAFAWLLTWRLPSGKSAVHWLAGAAIAVVTAIELVVVLIALIAPFSGAESWLEHLPQLGSPRVWAVQLWMPLTLWISVRVLLRRPRGRVRTVLIGIVPYLLVGLVFITMLALGLL